MLRRKNENIKIIVKNLLMDLLRVNIPFNHKLIFLFTNFILFELSTDEIRQMMIKKLEIK